MKRDLGDNLYTVAERFLMAGTGAAGRFYPAIGRPLYITRADGAYLFDVDGNKFIDYHMSAGASFLGHNNPAIKAGIEQAMAVGFFLGYETEFHGRLGRYISEMVPSAERVRFNTSGSEASAATIRLARAATGRKKILKFEGHFHGMYDYVFYNYDSVAPMHATGEIQLQHESDGVPDELDSLIVVLPFNDLETFASCMRRHRGEFAAVIMEPVVYNSGCILPKKDFVQLVREETARDGAVLIFDEVLSGFRMCPGGGQEYLGITPDLTSLSKALGCGLPIAAIAGKQEIMRHLTPTGRVDVSGTFTGHLIPLMGAVAALEEIRKPGFYDKINTLALRLYNGINELLARHKIKAVCQGLGARYAVFFGSEELPITDFRRAAQEFDLEMNREFTRLSLERGLYFRDFKHRVVPMHQGFSSAHTLEDVDETLDRLDGVLAMMSTAKARR